MIAEDRACRRLARRQHGVISEAQARDCGLSYTAVRRRVRSGEFVEIHPATFVLAGTPSSWTQRLWAAQLWIGPEGALSHRSAGALLEMEGLRPGFVEVTTQRVLRSEAVVVHRKKLLDTDARRRGGLRLTAPARTLLDLGDVLRFHAVERALDDSLHRGQVSLAELRKVLAVAGGRGVRGTAMLRELVDTRDPAYVQSQSTLERRLARLIKGGGLPKPVAQHEIFDENGLVARVDFAYPHVKVAIEAEGYRFHRDRQTWGRDLARRSALARLGWRVLHFTWEDVHDRPGWVINEIRRTLCLPVR